MKKLIIGILVLAFVSIAVAGASAYIRKYASNDVNTALQGFYDEHDASFRPYFTDWDGKKYVEK